MPQAIQSIVIAAPVLIVGLFASVVALNLRRSAAPESRRRTYRGFPRPVDRPSDED